MKTKLLIFVLMLALVVPAVAIDNTPLDASSSITTDATSQLVFVANSGRRWLFIQNISNETQYINFGAAATTDSNSIKLVAGAAYENPANYCPTTTVTIIGATSGKKYIAKQGG